MVVKQVSSGSLSGAAVPLAEAGPEPRVAAPHESPGPLPELHAGVVGALQALADPMRLAIVRRLANGTECPCGALGLPISKSTLSHHLHVLREAGIVIQREEGTRRMTSLDREGLGRRFPGLLEAVLAAGDGDDPPPC